VRLVWLEIRTIHLSEGDAITRCSRLEPSLCIGDEERRNVDAHATSAIGFRQANQELALTTRNVNHLRVSREAQKFHETRQFFLARGIAYHMFTVSDVVELPCVHDSQSFDGLNNEWHAIPRDFARLLDNSEIVCVY
jgi:hypothetical protein